MNEVKRCKKSGGAGARGAEKTLAATAVEILFVGGAAFASSYTGAEIGGEKNCAR